MPTTTSRQRSFSEALNQEAANLRAIADRLGMSIERFEAFMASHETAQHTAAMEMPPLSGDAAEDCEQLARKLQEERKLLIAAWEQLEHDQRKLLKNPERLPAKAEPAPAQPQPAAPRPGATLPPATPYSVNEATNISKRLQFQHLQREIDRRR